MAPIVVRTSRSVIFPCCPLNSRDSSADERISPIPNMPMQTVTKLKPLKREIESKVSLGVPVTMSRPTDARRHPRRADIRFFVADPPPRPTKVLNARSMTAKYSGGPNLRASSARGGAKKLKRIIETSEEKKPPIKATDSAYPALPCLASG